MALTCSLMQRIKPGVILPRHALLIRILEQLFHHIDMSCLRGDEQRRLSQLVHHGGADRSDLGVKVGAHGGSDHLLIDPGDDLPYCGRSPASRTSSCRTGRSACRNSRGRGPEPPRRPKGKGRETETVTMTATLKTTATVEMTVTEKVTVTETVTDWRRAADPDYLLVEL